MIDQSLELTGSAVEGVGVEALPAPARAAYAAMVARLPVVVKLGRIEPPAKPQVLRFGAYFNEEAMAISPPPSTNRRATAAPSLTRIYMNDQLGDCVIAGKAHALGLWSGADATPGGVVVATDQEIYQQYQGICGPGDNGCIITQVLDVMTAKGFLAGGKYYKIDGYVAGDHTNKLQVQVILYLFGASTIGIKLPQAWTSSDVWDVTTSRNVGGHDVTCLSGDTKIPLLNGKEYTIKELAEGGAGEKFWVYSCDEKGNVVPGLAHSARKTGEGRGLVKVTLDNGETIRCTPDHPFMLRDGTYREAGDLASGDSLMPLYRKLGTKQMKGYERVYNPATKRWRYTHRAVAADSHGGRYHGEVVHHKDFDKRNNAPDNLEVMSWEDHTKLHSENVALLNEYARSEEGRAKSREVIGRLWADPEWRAKMVKQLGENGRAACLRRAAEGGCGFQTWTREDHKRAAAKAGAKLKGRQPTPEARAKTSAGLRRRYATDPEAHARAVERAKAAGAAAGRQQRTGLTDAQRTARRENIKKAQAARMARKAAANNHKVVSVEPDGREDVYDLTVDVHHNFAVSSGVFVHNCLDYDEKGVYVASWGRIYLMTWAAFQSRKWVSEFYALLAPLWYGDDKLAPSGVDAATLLADLKKIDGGGIPPIPEPPPPKPPEPPPKPQPPPGPGPDPGWGDPNDNLWVKVRVNSVTGRAEIVSREAFQ